MDTKTNWRQVWENKSGETVSDFEVDRCRPLLDQEVEDRSEQELIDFIEPKNFETLLDAGCGTGINILRLHSRIRNIVGFDYAWGSLKRCQQRIQAHSIRNARLCMASVVAIPLPNRSVDKVLCLSVFQYLDDNAVRQALKEFVRVLAPGGAIILHIKNFWSFYWLTLLPVKKVKALLGMNPRIEHLRSFSWYVNELKGLGCTILDYDSFDLFMLDVIPQRFVPFVRRFELRNHRSPFFRNTFTRRHGAELMIKARVPVSRPESGRPENESNLRKHRTKHARNFLFFSQITGVSLCLELPE